jgi:uncharacterized repeat protein (TIGR03847 family)
MPEEIELNPVDFITVGTIGPKGKRVFHLQAGQGNRLITLIMEKEQARALSQAASEMLQELNARDTESEGEVPEVNLNEWDMDLREPIQPEFRVAQMGLGYDEARDMIVLVAQELAGVQDELGAEEPDIDPTVIRFWCSREQARALSQHTIKVVEQGRADPRQNGRVVHYWM